MQGPGFTIKANSQDGEINRIVKMYIMYIRKQTDANIYIYLNTYFP